MKFSCQTCQAKYSIPDDRVENKVVRLACQKCGAEIVVRGPVAAPASATKKPLPAAFFDEDDDDEREGGDTTRIANLSELETMRQRALSEANAAKAASAKPKAVVAPPPPPPEDETREWMTLVHGEQRGPYSVEEIVGQTRSGALHEKSYIWKEGMDEWQRISALAPFKSLFVAAPKPPPPAAVETGDATIPEFDTRAPGNKPKTSVQAIASLNETQPGMKVDDFDALFGPKSKDAERPAPPPLMGSTGTDVHQLDDEPSGPNHLGDAPSEEEIEKPSTPRAPTRMLMRQAGLDERQRNQRLFIIIGVAALAVILGFVLLAVLGVIDAPGLGSAYDLVGNESASAPASQPAVVVSDEDKKRIREQLMGKGKPEAKDVPPPPAPTASKPAPEASPPAPAPTPTPPPPPKEEVLPEGLKAEQITQVVSSRAGAVKSCYERELKRGTQVRGKLVVAFSITNTGTVSQASVTTAELRDGELAKCVVSAVKAWKFPRFSGDTVSVEYPFLLSPSE